MSLGFLRNRRFVDLASPIVIASLGFFINAMYFSFKYFERNEVFLPKVWTGLLEQALIISTIPLYLAIGLIYSKEKHARKELENSNNLKDLFTDILSHDLLSPLSVVQSGMELIEESAEDKEVVDMIKRQAWRLEDTILNASKLSQIDAIGRPDLVESDLGRYLKTTLEEMEPFAQKKGISIIGEFKEEYPVKIHPIFKEALLNLVSNAIKFSPTDSQITMAVKTHGKFWHIIVSDHGPGIPDEYKQNVFNRFTRREKGAIKGSGLGLAIVRRIVDLHNGDVWIEDNMPRGAIFYVKLPKEG